MRSCPLCSVTRSPFYHHPLTFHPPQPIVACPCGMIYADSPAADYSEQSIYAKPGAIGSGESLPDSRRLAQTATDILAHIPLCQSSPILDIGCARGGLLREFQSRGYSNLSGLDPSESCLNSLPADILPIQIDITRDLIPGSYSLAILSHVLEHLERPVEALENLSAITDWLYVEVPDAARYADFPNPFLDFNAEHINHFTSATLIDCLRRAGFSIHALQHKVIQLTNGSDYAALWAIARPTIPAHDSISRYIEQSERSLEAINAKLESDLGPSREIILWGAGSYFANILPLPAIASRLILQIVDNNPSLWAKETRRGQVVSPAEIVFPVPIVIATLVGTQSIAAEIKQRGLRNKVVTIV